MTRAINEAIRKAAGRPAPALDREHQRPTGDLGIGRGGAAGVQQPQVTNAEVNERIRAGARIVRDVQIRGGINLNLDEPWR